jgi:Flp pilus assembly protein TadG
MTHRPPDHRAGLRRRAADTSAHERPRGQALAEFALVIPVFFLLIAGIIQFGLVFWSQQTLTQIARDTGRWAATQTYCDSNTTLVTQEANGIAANSTLFGYTANLWANGGLGITNKVAVTWPRDIGEPCPPASNQDEAWVQVQIDHQIPVFFPFIPGDGRLTTTAEFRMEPEPV